MIELKAAMGAVDVCWNHTGQLVDASAVGASPVILNTASAQVLVMRGTATAKTASQVAELVRDYLDGDVEAYLSFLGGA